MGRLTSLPLAFFVNLMWRIRLKDCRNLNNQYPYDLCDPPSILCNPLCKNRNSPIRAICGYIYFVKKFRDEKFLKQFGEHLRMLRKGRQLSQEDFASLAETPTSQIGRFERGERAPTILTLLILSRALEVHPKELMDFQVD